jgi:hypothetical protein
MGHYVPFFSFAVANERIILRERIPFDGEMCVRPFLFDHAAVTRKLRTSGEEEEKHRLPLRNIYLPMLKSL